jgi:hypothetical protein
VDVPFRVNLSAFEVVHSFNSNLLSQSNLGEEAIPECVKNGRQPKQEAENKKKMVNCNSLKFYFERKEGK